MAEVGVIPPPAGVTPSFHDVSHLQNIVITIFSVTFGVATLVMILRLYTAAFIVRKVNLDSPIIVIAWGVSLAFFICMVKAMPAGFGKHLWDVTPTQLQGYLNLLLALALTYIWPPTLTKLAILVLYHRLNADRYFRFGVYAVAFSLVSYTVVFTALFAGPCNPQAEGTGTCLNNIAVAQAVLNIISDAALIILPIPMIVSLNMPVKQKVAVILLLALGSAVVLVSCVRVAYVQRMQKNPDVTWTQASAAVWSSLELNLGIVCNCAAQLKPFVRKHMPWLAGIVGYDSGNNQRSYPKPNTTGTNFTPWRGDGGAHAYQLHSVDRAKNPREAEGLDPKGIVVVDEYRVQYNRKSDNGDASSTEDILVDKQPGVL